MGRAFWILDDVSPLRQIGGERHEADAARGRRTIRMGRSGVAVGSGAGAGGARRTLRSRRCRPRGSAPGTDRDRSVPQRRVAAIKPFDGSNVFLFTPAPAYRMHYQPLTGRADQPEYPAAGARIDYYLASPSGEVKLDILDAAGTVVRSYSSESRPAAGGRGGGVAAADCRRRCRSKSA